MTLEPGQSTLLSLNGHLRTTHPRPRPKPAVHLPTIQGARRITRGVNERYVIDLFEESRRRFAEGIAEELEDEDGIPILRKRTRLSYTREKKLAAIAYATMNFQKDNPTKLITKYRAAKMLKVLVVSLTEWIKSRTKILHQKKGTKRA